MKYLNKIVLLFLTSSLLFFSGCDELSQLTLNVPLVINFGTSGPNTSTEDTEYFCLSDYTDWEENQDDIESAKFLTASYWTLDATPNLEGNVTVYLYDSNGSVIFTYNLGTITAADYIDEPFELTLTQAQIDVFDGVLSNLSGNNGCFTSKLTVTNITGTTNSSGNYVLNGKVEIVLETEVNTD